MESIRAAAAAAGIHTVGHTLALTLSSHPNMLGWGPWEETGIWFSPQFVDVQKQFFLYFLNLCRKV